MKKFMRIALVFALAGAALMYTGCTKDYSGDISDLNKKVSEQASALSALQTQVAAAQSSASEALSSAQNALKEAQAAAKAAEAANNDAEVAALTTKIATIEGNIANLQAKVEALNGLEAKLNEVADQLKKDVDAKVDAALEEIQKELEKAIAQVEGNFNVTAVSSLFQFSKYAVAKWNPSTKTVEKKYFDKVAEVFPEIAKIEKETEIEVFGALPFIVNPSSVELDDTYTFSLVNKYGEDFGFALGNPAPGYAVKAGSNVWNVEIQSPAYDEKGKAHYGDFRNLALVVESAGGVSAQTAFDYTIQASDFRDTDTEFTISKNDDEFTFDGKAYDVFENGLFAQGIVPIYENCFVIEADDDADVEEFGIEINGSEITFKSAPVGGASIGFKIYAVGVNGRASYATANLTLKGTIAPNAELAAKEVTLGYNANKGTYNVFVDYAVADFGFSALEWKTIYQAVCNNKNKVKVTKSESDDDLMITDANVTYYSATGAPLTNKDDYAKVATMRVTVKSNAENALPGTYTITISDGQVFCGTGKITLVNPEACPIKLAEALCDADGVLQIVGDVKEYFVEYDLTDALVYNTKEAGSLEFTDVKYEELGTPEQNWLDGESTFRIPVQGEKWNDNLKNQKLLYTPREFSVQFTWFAVEDGKNYGEFTFKAEAVSPIYDEAGKGANITVKTTGADGKEAVHATIYSQPGEGESATANLNAATFTVKYMAGTKKGQTVNVKNATSTQGTTFGWKNPTDTAGCLPKLSAPVTAQPDSIAHTNVTGGDSTFVVGTNNKLYEVSLDKALELKWITIDQFISYNADPDGFKYYLTKDNWKEMYDIWSEYWKDTHKYAGRYIAHTTPADEIWYENIVSNEIKLTDASLTTLSKSTVEADILKYAKYTYFNSIFVSIKCEKYAKGDCATSDGTVGSSSTSVEPDELNGYPYFTCADAGQYDKYVNFTTDPTANTHITAVTVKANAAGKSTVEIPLTLNVVDKWGMTSKKEFIVTVKVKE